MCWAARACSSRERGPGMSSVIRLGTALALIAAQSVVMDMVVPLWQAGTGGAPEPAVGGGALPVPAAHRLYATHPAAERRERTGPRSASGRRPALVCRGRVPCDQLSTARLSLGRSSTNW